MTTKTKEEIKEIWQVADNPFFGPATRAISIFGDIDRETSLMTISQLLDMDSEKNETIYIYINSDGGTLTDSLAIYDTIRMIRSEVVTISIGSCASGALLILLAGDTKISCPNTLYYYHQAIFPSDVFLSKHQATSMSNAYTIYQERYDSILLERTNMKKHLWNKHFKDSTATYFTAKDALKFNMIDHINHPEEKETKKWPQEDEEHEQKAQTLSDG